MKVILEKVPMCDAINKVLLDVLKDDFAYSKHSNCIPTFQKADLILSSEKLKLSSLKKKILGLKSFSGWIMYPDQIVIIENICSEFENRSFIEAELSNCQDISYHIKSINSNEYVVTEFKKENNIENCNFIYCEIPLLVKQKLLPNKQVIYRVWYEKIIESIVNKRETKDKNNFKWQAVNQQFVGLVKEDK